MYINLLDMHILQTYNKLFVHVIMNVHNEINDLVYWGMFSPNKQI